MPSMSRSVLTARRWMHHYRTNKGVVEGAWVFCRHGDRTPGRCLSPAHRQEEEAAFWMTKLPYPDSFAAFEQLSRFFPVHVQQKGLNEGEFLDTKRNPFGFLTQKGLEQLHENGRRFFERYNSHGHHLPTLQKWKWEHAGDFLTTWNIKVYSTNYLRTILSTQSFLDGLLGTHAFQTVAERTYNPAIHREARIPTHASLPRESLQRHNLLQVHVRDVRNDPLNAFDRNPDLMADLVGEVMTTDEFQYRDGANATLAARLANALPGLVRPRRSDFSRNSPSGINWVEAADHFVCRKAHDVTLSRFTDFEHDDRVEQTLAAMSRQTLHHLAWRFRMWYQNVRLLAALAAPPLREVADGMATIPRLSDVDKRPFNVYSCHDVTILGLLYGIRANFLVDQWHNFWPAYGSTLVFELVRIEEETTPAMESYVVRVLFNGQPVAFAEDGHGPEGMMNISDFQTLLCGLEKAGGHDYSKLLGKTKI